MSDAVPNKNRQSRLICPGFLLLCCLAIFPNTALRAASEVLPPKQDYYLHFSQHPKLSQGSNAMMHTDHGVAYLWEPLPEMDQREDGSWTDELTVETWVLWESSDLEEIQAATGLDIDRMTLLCGTMAYGFQYGSNGSEGWTFFLETTDQSYPDTGTIPLPRGEWAHLAASYDGAVIRTFLNGVKQTESQASGGVRWFGDAFRDQCEWRENVDITRQSPLSIGVGTGFTGGMRQLRLWNRALSENELSANAGVHLAGDEPGLVGYWPMDDPFADVPPTAPGFENFGGLRFLTFTNKANLDRPLYSELRGPGPSWRLTDPMFVVREDLAEDVLLLQTDCYSLPYNAFDASTLVDIHLDGDLDLVISGVGTPPGVDGQTCFGGSLTTVEAMIRDGDNGFVWDTRAAFAGETILTQGSQRSAVGDFNGDDQPDVFIGNGGPDFCTGFGETEPGAGAPNTLLLSRPDGRLEDASANLFGASCTAVEPQFEGQHPCYGGKEYGGRPPGARYPAGGEPVPLTDFRDFTHGVSAGDTDGDGDLDIVLANANHFAHETASILVNDGHGRFIADWELLPDSFYQEMIGPNGVKLNNFLLEDLDGDGRIDLVTQPTDVPLRSGNWVTGIYWNDGSGDFSETVPMIIEPTEGTPNPHTSGAMVALDIDNDGDKDLLISWDSDQWRTEAESLQLLVNQGGRVFVDETVARIGAPPQWDLARSFTMVFHAEDVNHDGCVDILFVNSVERTYMGAGIWLNDCKGNFSPNDASTFTKKNSYYFPLDYDDDGDIDFISLRDLRVYRGNNPEHCAENEGGGTDYYDLAVLLNQSISRVDINAGFNDAWRNPVKKGGQGVFVVVFPDIQYIFLAWFTYDLTLPDEDIDYTVGHPSQRWYTAFGPYIGDTAELDLELNSGGIFDSAAPFNQVTDGSVTLKAINCEEMLLSYHIASADISGEIPLGRITDDNVAYCEDLSGNDVAGDIQKPKSQSRIFSNMAGTDINAGFNDAWRNPEKKGGQGIFAVVFPIIKHIFMAWFTYDTEQPDEDIDYTIGHPSQRWYTAFGPYVGDEAVLELELNSNGKFDSADAIEQMTDGSVTLKSIDCEEMLLEYDIFSADLQGEIPLERLAEDNVAYCASLEMEAQ